MALLDHSADWSRRPETESYAHHLATLLAQNLPASTAAPLRVLDACSGSGCIALLLLQRLALRPGQPLPEVLGLDVEPRAIALARKNVAHNVRRGHLRADAARAVRFEELDVLQAAAGRAGGLRPTWDIVVSNPPYISHRGYATETSRSARNHEPVRALKAALRPERRDGPPDDGADCGDGFYLPILGLAHRLQSHIALLEVGGREQALRVLQRALSSHPYLLEHWTHVEIWNDDPHLARVETELVHASRTPESSEPSTLAVPRRGEGHARSLVFATDLGSRWLGTFKP